MMLAKDVFVSLAIALLASSSASAFCSPRPITAFQKTTTTFLKMNADFQLDPKETAFVFIEYQNEFTTEGGKLHDAVKECMAATNSK
jgi:hypothetical protein